jgi:hypothetical protein
VKKYFISEKNISFIKISGRGHVHVYYPSHAPTAFGSIKITVATEDLMC